MRRDFSLDGNIQQESMGMAPKLSSGKEQDSQCIYCLISAYHSSRKAKSI